MRGGLNESLWLVQLEAQTTTRARSPFKALIRNVLKFTFKFAFEGEAITHSSTKWHNGFPPLESRLKQIQNTSFILYINR